MPTQSRAQRRRQAQRPSQRPERSVGVGSPADVTAPPAEELGQAMPPLAPTLVEPQPAAPRPPRASRRSGQRAAEPLDYSQDYASSRRDLVRIVVISIVLFAVMVAISFSGLI